MMRKARIINNILRQYGECIVRELFVLSSILRWIEYIHEKTGDIVLLKGELNHHSTSILEAMMEKERKTGSSEGVTLTIKMT